MPDIRVMIVDDSPFTVTVMKDILTKHGYNVVGSAGNLDEVIEGVVNFMPDLVTMDMTLPGTDGLECTRVIHAFDSNIKVIAVSAMKDDALVSEALRHNIHAYVQKPINEDELLSAIKKIMTTEEMFETFDNSYFDVFKDCFSKALVDMIKITPKFLNDKLLTDDFESNGLAAFVNIAGEFPGRMVLSMSKATAASMAVSILKREPNDASEISYLLMELVNIVAGNACSALNKENIAYNLRIAPPSILSGQVLVSSADYKTRCTEAESAVGNIMLCVGFRQG